MQRALIVIGVAAALIVATGAAALQTTPGRRLLLDMLAARVPQTAFAERKSLVAKGATFTVPEAEDEAGGARLPIVLQFHGCGRPDAPFMRQWASVAHAEGYMTGVFDSLTPRGVSEVEARTGVCTGARLLGQERAGDVLAALEIAREHPRVDPERIVLAGWSHGGFSIMDMLALQAAERPPAGLSDAPPPANIRGLALFYPYCGRGARTTLHGWASKPPTIAFVAGSDSVVNGAECRRIFDDLAAEGAPIDLVYYPDANHQFDDTTLDPLFSSFYGPEEHADAIERYTAFLRRLK